MMLLSGGARRVVSSSLAGIWRLRSSARRVQGPGGASVGADNTPGVERVLAASPPASGRDSVDGVQQQQQQVMAGVVGVDAADALEDAALQDDALDGGADEATKQKGRKRRSTSTAAWTTSFVDAEPTIVAALRARFSDARVHGWDFEVKQTSREATITFVKAPVPSLNARLCVVVFESWHTQICAGFDETRVPINLGKRATRRVFGETADARISAETLVPVLCNVADNFRLCSGREKSELMKRAWERARARCLCTRLMTRARCNSNDRRCHARRAAP